jgi:hypothetical protein
MQVLDAPREFIAPCSGSEGGRVWGLSIIKFDPSLSKARFEFIASVEAPSHAQPAWVTEANYFL